MASSVDIYTDSTHNSLAKVVALDLIEAINGFAQQDNTRIHEDLCRAGVIALAANGSAFHILSQQEIPFPRNLHDLDMMVIGTSRFDANHSKVGLSSLIEEAAHRIGASAAFLPKGDGSAESRLMSLSRIGGLKQTYHVTQLFSPDRLREIVRQSTRYRLSANDSASLDQLIEMGEPIKIMLKVDINALTQKPDLPPLNFDGSEATLRPEKFNGVYLPDWVEQVAQKARALNMPNRNSPCDVLDVYNCALASGQADGIIGEDALQQFYKKLRCRGSTFNSYSRALGAMDRQLDAVLGYTRVRCPDATPEAVENYRGRCEELVRQNILHAVPDNAALTRILHAGHVNSNKLFGPAGAADAAHAIRISSQESPRR